MKFIRRYFIAGSLIVLPVLITIFLFLWAFQLLDGVFGNYIDGYMLSHYGYTLPGSGIIFAVVLILIVGFLASHLISRGILGFFEGFFIKFPIIKRVYPAVKQIVGFLFSDRKYSFRKVVLVEYPRKGVYIIGFLTNDSSRIFRDMTRRELVNIFVPSTPSPVTGFLILVPKDDLLVIDISVEEAFKMLISGGVVNPSEQSSDALPF